MKAQTNPLVLLIDWSKVRSLDHAKELFKGLQFSPGPQWQALDHVLYPADSVTLEPYTPHYKEGFTFHLGQQELGIVKHQEQIGYINERGIMMYYCASVSDLKNVELYEIEEFRVDDIVNAISRYTRPSQAPPTTSPNLPATLDEAVDYLMPRFTGFESILISKSINSADEFAAYCHGQLSGGIGMQVRNELLLWEKESSLHMSFVEDGVTHPDAMSAIILKRIYERIVARHVNTTRPVEDFEGGDNGINP